jgi:alpha-tubulin suppressor-like RCC1 family protein
MLYVLTEKSNLYRINCETKTYELVKDEDSQIDEDEVRCEITQIACGTDFIVTLRGNGHIFSMGKNACGQLGHGNFEP